MSKRSRNRIFKSKVVWIVVSENIILYNLNCHNQSVVKVSWKITVCFCCTERVQFQSTQVVGWKTIDWSFLLLRYTSHCYRVFIDPSLFLLPFRKKLRPSQTPLLCHQGRYGRWDWVMHSFCKKIAIENNNPTNIDVSFHGILLTAASMTPQFHLTLQRRDKLCAKYNDLIVS